MNRTRGFTLIEIAVVLFIVALLAGAIAQYLTGQIATAKQGITLAREATIKTALTNFIARNNRLPCPAVAATPSGAPLDGVEATPGTCAGTILTAVTATGTIPWVNLGLPSDAAMDGYSNRFTYQVTLAATSLTAQTVMGMKGESTVHSAGAGVVGSPNATPAGNQLNDCRTNLAVAYLSAANPCAAVAVIVSHGPDGYGAYTDSGVQIAFPGAVTGLDARENADGDSKFVMKAFSGNSANPFDDVVMALTPNDLIGALTNTGGMQSALAALNANLNLIKSAVIANAFQTRVASSVCQGTTCFPTTNCPGGANPNTCEITTFTYTILAPDTVSSVQNGIPAALALPATVTNDPWNNSIKYTTTGALPVTINSATAASAVAFTLTSAGPDGTLGNADDVATTVYVGEVRTQFSKF